MGIVPIYRKRSEQRGDLQVFCYAVVDAEFAAEASRYKWQVNQWGYPMCGGAQQNGERVQSLHQLVWVLAGRDLPEMPLSIDHIDQNKFNCQLGNLRVAGKGLQASNAGVRKDNTSGYKCVFSNPSGMWSAICRLNGKAQFLGSFHTREGAAREANDFYREHHPGAAPPNPTVKFMPGWIATRHFIERRDRPQAKHRKRKTATLK